VRNHLKKPNPPQQALPAKLTQAGEPLFSKSLYGHSSPQWLGISGNQAVQRLLQSNAGARIAGPTNAAPTPFGHDFSRKPISPSPSGIQPKQTVSTPGDIHEEEADRVAAEVMRTREPQQQRSSFSSLPGKTRLQAKPGQSTNSAGAAAASVVKQALSQTGHPLDVSTRNFMEPGFGVDFSQVRVHTDLPATKSAKALGARAFTLGDDIVFGAGQYVPGSQATQQLLAHELAHVVQQREGRGGSHGEAPFIQRQAESPSVDAGAQGASLRREYIELTCEIIAGIQRAIEEGRTWTFEDELLLQGEERLSVHQPTLVDERVNALQELIRGLDEIIQALNSGALVPADPPSRAAIADIWAARNPESRGLAQRWAGVHRRISPNGEPFWFSPSLDSYVVREASSPPGMLRSAAFPAWWVLDCHPYQQAEPSPVPSALITPDELHSDWVIFISRTGTTIMGWDAESRNAPHTEASRPFGPYEWYHDQSSGRVFIVVDGRQVTLLRHGRVEL
jgi:hypothetical protein